eukprot:6104069-Prymnesium_polylepis.1
MPRECGAALGQQRYSIESLDLHADLAHMDGSLWLRPLRVCEGRRRAAGWPIHAAAHAAAAAAASPRGACRRRSQAGRRALRGLVQPVDMRDGR